MIGKALSSGAFAIIFTFAALDFSPVQNQNPAQEQETLVQLRADLVLVPVEVTSKKSGLPVSGLKREDFVIFEDGVLQQIAFFGQDDIPLSLLLLIEAWHIRDVARAARLILARLKPEDEVAAMIFYGNPCLIQGFTKDKDLVAKKLEELAVKGEHWWGLALLNNTCTWQKYYHVYSLLWTSIYEGAEYMLRATERGGRRAMIVFTYNLGEGHPNMMTEKERRELKQKVLKRLYESDIVVSRVLLGYSYRRFIWGVMGRPAFKAFGMDELVKVTGGRMGSAKPGQQLNVDKLAQLIDHLRAQYVLGYVPANAARDGKFRKIKIELSPAAKKKYKDVQLRYRQGYIAAGGREGEPK